MRSMLFQNLKESEAPSALGVRVRASHSSASERGEPAPNQRS